MTHTNGYDYTDATMQSIQVYGPLCDQIMSGTTSVGTLVTVAYPLPRAGAAGRGKRLVTFPGGATLRVVSIDRATVDAARADDTDEQLVVRARAHDRAAFELLMRRHNQRIFRVVRSILRGGDEIEDVIQQAYLQAFPHLDQFGGNARWSTWVCRIAINEALARIRQRGRFVSIDAASEDAMADFSKGPNSDPERAAAGREFGHLVEQAIDGLPDIYRSVPDPARGRGHDDRGDRRRPRHRGRRGEDAAASRARGAACVARGSRRRTDDRTRSRLAMNVATVLSRLCLPSWTSGPARNRPRATRRASPSSAFRLLLTVGRRHRCSRQMRSRRQFWEVCVGLVAVAGGCGSDSNSNTPSVDPTLAAQGKDIFRHDTFGDETFWTDTLKMNEVIQAAVDPMTALVVGLKVDAEALPAEVVAGVQDGTVSLDQPGDDGRAAEAERGRRRRGHRRERQRHGHADAGRDHVRAVPLDRRRFVHEGDRQAAGRLAQPTI